MSPGNLASKLAALGYSPSAVVQNPGTFCQKGEIFDVHPLHTSAVRIQYYDDMIEEIFSIDPASQRTLKHKSLQKIHLGPSPHIFILKKFHHSLRENLLRTSQIVKKKHEKRRLIFEQLNSGSTFEGFSHCSSLFVKSPEILLSFFDPKNTLLHVIEPSNIFSSQSKMLEQLKEEYNTVVNDTENSSLMPSPESFYINNINDFLVQFKRIEIPGLDFLRDDGESINFRPLSSFSGCSLHSFTDRHNYIHEILKIIKGHFEYSGFLLYLYSDKNSLANFKELLNFDELKRDFKERISFLPFHLDAGFYSPEEEVLVLSESDIFSTKKTKVKQKINQEIDIFAENFSHLKIGDLVIHSQFGLGRYLGLQSLNVEKTGDYLIIEYLGGDKIYVPSYNLGFIQKYATDQSTKKLDSLRSNRFSKVKTLAKKSAKKLAFNLLKLQAERTQSQAFAFSPPDQYYREFELLFPFEETADQRAAIESVLSDMQSEKPMDRLVCGDVGFGKTEVAMRASFKAVLDNKQVVIMVPTTILALQHYNSFKDRFRDVPVEIDFLSRLKTSGEAKKIKEKLKNGTLDIIIATHKILSSIEFSDLGLVVIDEEQRFGVTHKEKLKLLKSSVDVLTLTATPIPRTLQLSLLGLRELSLMRTPPPKRQSIKTYIVKHDDLVIEKAIRKELERKGKVFIVYNKIKDIERYASKIKALVPEGKILVAHGRLRKDELEKRMNDFYTGSYQILISTTIIESGLDIPEANTMIIERADLFGLAQLHQLRGRIGRSDKKAFCYFVIPDGSLTREALKRLEVLQTYVDVGQGFYLANSDMEIRGAGDILGAGQSGHVESVGLELYIELLQEAISEIEGGKRTIKNHVEISTPFPSFIPEEYVKDSSLRLKYYKRLSTCKSVETLDNLVLEVEDIFGTPPREFLNLVKILKIKMNVESLGISSFKVAGSSIFLKLDKKTLEEFKEIRDKIVDFFVARPKIYQITPNYEITCLHNRPPSLIDLLDFSVILRKKILPNQ